MRRSIDWLTSILAGAETDKGPETKEFQFEFNGLLIKLHESFMRVAQLSLVWLRERKKNFEEANDLGIRVAPWKSIIMESQDTAGAW